MSQVQQELDRYKDSVTQLRSENSTYMQGELKQKLELDKLSAMFEQLKCSEEILREKSDSSTKEIERLKHKMERDSQKVRNRRDLFNVIVVVITAPHT